MPATLLRGAGGAPGPASSSSAGAPVAGARKVGKTVELDDWFGIAIVGVPTPTSPSDRLPQVGAPVRLKSGSLRNS